MSLRPDGSQDNENEKEDGFTPLPDGSQFKEIAPFLFSLLFFCLAAARSKQCYAKAAERHFFVRCLAAARVSRLTFFIYCLAAARVGYIDVPYLLPGGSQDEVYSVIGSSPPGGGRLV